jgi:hypothetical protein
MIAAAQVLPPGFTATASGAGLPLQTCVLLHKVTLYTGLVTCTVVFDRK